MNRSRGRSVVSVSSLAEAVTRLAWCSFRIAGRILIILAKVFRVFVSPCREVME